VQFAARTDPTKRLRRLCRKKFARHRRIDWRFIRDVQEYDRAMEVLGGEDTPFFRLFRLADLPAHRELTVEFYSTFRYRPRPLGQQEAEREAPDVPEGEPEPPGEVEFSLFGQQMSMSLAAFGVHAGLYTDAETLLPLYNTAVRPETIDEAEVRLFWTAMSDEAPVDRKARVTTMHDPLYRIIHRALAISITGRHASKEWATIPDISYLYCILIRRPVALAECLAKYFADYAARSERGRILGGQYITRIARSLGRYDEFVGDLSPPILPHDIGRTSIVNMGIARLIDHQTGYRLIGEDGQVWVPQPFEMPAPIAAEVVEVIQADDPLPDEPVPPELQPDQPQQQRRRRRRTYEAVRLPAHVSRDIRHMRRRIDRLEQLVMWQVEALRRMAPPGLDLGDLPPPIVYPEDQPAGAGDGAEAGGGAAEGGGAGVVPAAEAGGQ
jgi:hypothetical protein